MKKLLCYILLSLYTFTTGNFSVFFSDFKVENADAATQTWDFNVQSDYTRSTSTGLTVSGSVMQLEKSVLTHTGVIANATNHNGAYDVVVDGIYAYMTNFD